MKASLWEHWDVTGPAHIVANEMEEVEAQLQIPCSRQRSLVGEDPVQVATSVVGREDLQDIWEALEASLPALASDPLEQCITALDAHFEVEANVPYERHQFRQMAQKQDETVAQFVVRLQNQAQFCDFKDDADQIRDQLVQGLKDNELRQKMLETTNISLKDAMTMASKKEISEVQSRDMRGQDASPNTPAQGDVEAIKPDRIGATPSTNRAKKCLLCVWQEWSLCA